MYRAPPLAAALFAAILILAGAAPAKAGWGAIAYDQYSGKLGSSWNQPTRERAADLALKNCNSRDCQVHSVEPAGCGALARSDKDKAWGGADRESLDEAKKEAIAHCQSHTADGTCAVSVSGCND
jgi:hypothetical protein